MPGGDRTGPSGHGPMTGRGMGYCTGTNAPGSSRPVAMPGRGFGRGFARGMGRGFGWRRAASINNEPIQTRKVMTKEQEIQMLEQEAQTLEEEQKAIQSDIDSIKIQIEELKNQDR